ncbi:MAG: metalloregulator ArsR/SmtB family transcription factor [Steroidobacteraceae bacterium]
MNKRNEPGDDVLVQALQAVGEPGRLRLLRLALGGEHAATELARLAGLSNSAASQHLEKLVSAGLLGRRRDGRRVFYRAQSSAAWTALGDLLSSVQSGAAHAAATAGGDPSGAALQLALRDHLVALLARAGTQQVCLPQSLHPVLAPVVARARLSLLCYRPGENLAALATTPGCLIVMDARSLGGAAIGEEIYRQRALAERTDCRLLLLCRYDALEGMAAAHPLMAVRRYLATAGFESLRMQPLDADGIEWLLVEAGGRCAAQGAA